MGHCIGGIQPRLSLVVDDVSVKFWVFMHLT